MGIDDLKVMERYLSDAELSKIIGTMKYQHWHVQI